MQKAHSFLQFKFASINHCIKYCIFYYKDETNKMFPLTIFLEDYIILIFAQLSYQENIYNKIVR